MWSVGAVCVISLETSKGKFFVVCADYVTLIILKDHGLLYRLYFKVDMYRNSRSHMHIESYKSDNATVMRSYHNRKTRYINCDN